MIVELVQAHCRITVLEIPQFEPAVAISLSENIGTDLVLSLGQAFPQLLISHHWNVTTVEEDVLWRLNKLIL